MKLQNKCIVITGAASGIGQQIALQLLGKNAIVIGVDLNLDALEGTKSLAGDKHVNFFPYQLDISNHEAVKSFHKEVMNKHINIHGLINNAGIIQPFTDVKNLDFNTMERVMNVNFYGSLYLIKAFLPHFLEQKHAHIVNVASMGAFIPFPGQTIYGSSKAAVKLLSEGLYAELKDTNVKVTLAMPGAIDTNIMENSQVQMINKGSEKGNVKMLSASKAAEIILKAVENDKFRVLVGSDAKFLDKLSRLLPTWSINFIVKKMKRH